MSNFLPYQNDKYRRGIMLDEYNGTWSLVSAQEAENGTVYKEWCHPSRDKKPIEKSLPWKIKLGDSAQDAFDTLAYFGKILRDKL